MTMKPLIAAGALLALGLIQLPQAQAGPASETVYFTTFNGGGEDVWQSTMTYTGNGTAGNGTFSPGTPTNLASTPGADGIVFNPNNGQLLVGGQNTGNIYQVNPAGGNQYTALNAGMNTYEITVDPSGNVVWGGGSEGGATTITSVPINPTGGAPTVTPVSGSDNTVTHITFVPGQAPGTAFYTTGGDDGFGDFGTINLATGKTTAILTNVKYAHGMVYDPFTHDLIISGGNELAQIDPTTDAVISTAFFDGDELDQGAVDGAGHLFWADNNGNLLFIDYSNTGKIGDSSDFVSNHFFISQLDDLAPLSGEGSTPVPEPATWGLFAAALAGLALVRRNPVRQS
ncbi:MAG TPA: PEP-CTERM sorting domain-containing protein [Stellaceae bacterium]|nr:PEP-CTERM sorting domain-containing protein [Stellaceae bacterium]